MGKIHRGSLLKKEVPRSGRGYCQVTKRSGVKLLYDYEFEGQQIKISKLGRAILDNRRKREEKRAAQAARSASEAASEVISKEKTEEKNAASEATS